MIESWVISAAGYMIIDVVSPPPGASPLNVSRASIAYKHVLEIWLEVLRDEYERAVARSPIERGVLIGETRTLDTCFAFSNAALSVTGSTVAVTPFTRFIIDSPVFDIGGVTATASSYSQSVKERALEAATRWNLLDNRLATLFANRRTFPQKRVAFGDEPLLAMALERWSKLRASDPSNLAFDDAVKMLGLSSTQKKTLKGAGAIDLRTIAQLLRVAPETESYNARLEELHVTYKRNKIETHLPDVAPILLNTRDAEAIRKSLATTLNKLAAPESDRD